MVHVLQVSFHGVLFLNTGDEQLGYFSHDDVFYFILFFGQSMFRKLNYKQIIQREALQGQAQAREEAHSWVKKRNHYPRLNRNEKPNTKLPPTAEAQKD